MSRLLIIIVLSGLIMSMGLTISSAEEASSTSVGEETIPVDSGSLVEMLEAFILQKGIKILKGNIEAARGESGEIDIAIRAVLGISIRDIKKYGLLGGPNSEMRKLFETLGLVKEIEG